MYTDQVEIWHSGIHQAFQFRGGVYLPMPPALQLLGNAYFSSCDKSFIAEVAVS